MTEEVILEGCLRNNPVAQRELYNTYSPKMLAVCFRYAHSREDAEDMLQEGFIKVFTQLHTFENRGSFEGWIRRIIVHTCINILKKNKKFNESVDLIHAATISIREETVPAVVQVKQIVDCIRSLPIGYRTVLNLFAIEGDAEALGCCAVAVVGGGSRSLLSRSLLGRSLLSGCLRRRRL